MTAANLRVATIRRHAAGKGLRVWKVSARSRHYPECGPFALVDADTNGIVSAGLDLDELAAAIDRW